MADSQEYSVFSAPSGEAGRAWEARQTARRAFTATLATHDAETGYPFATLVSVSVSEAGDPILLLSGLARHTKNIAASARASLLFESSVVSGDPLESGRLTVQGDIETSASDTVRTRYLVRHPEAAGYADFSDFNFYKFSVRHGHYIAGFGRIVSFARDVLCLPGDTQSPSADLSALSQTFQDTLRAQWRAQVGGLGPQSTRDDVVLKILSFDRDGFDLRNGEAIQRIPFPGVLEPGATLKQALEAMRAQSQAHDCRDSSEKP